MTHSKNTSQQILTEFVAQTSEDDGLAYYSRDGPPAAHPSRSTTGCNGTLVDTTTTPWLQCKASQISLDGLWTVNLNNAMIPYLYFILLLKNNHLASCNTPKDSDTLQSLPPVVAPELPPVSAYCCEDFIIFSNIDTHESS